VYPKTVPGLYRVYAEPSVWRETPAVRWIVGRRNGRMTLT
jgi:hypothetical protein